jgi:hypothetical protein
MVQAQDNTTQPNWQPYSLDRRAQKLVLDRRDLKDVLNESHKMRMSVGYGLERFWGEHIRLQRESQPKALYWKAVWDNLAEILQEVGSDIVLPTQAIDSNNTTQIKTISAELWRLPIEHQRVALMVLTQFCDALVWWTQRYKKPTREGGQ